MLGETSLKRKRGANRLNCAECRRLKLRCDRAIPCNSCMKRGCGAICPTGTVTTGKGNRYALASTVTEKELHDRILLLSYRIRDLEDALRVQHASVSPDTHPLLAEGLLSIKTSPQRVLSCGREDNAIPQSENEYELDVVDILCGSISTMAPGKSRYYGHTASSWYFLQLSTLERSSVQNGMDAAKPGASEGTALTHSSTGLPPELTTATSLLGYTRSTDCSLHDLLSCLPSLTIALALREIYFMHAAWMYNPISAEVFDKEICSTFYNRCTPLTDDQFIREKLSILFTVLAIGSLMDVSLQAFNIEAERYHQLAKAVLFQTPLLEAPSLHSVQALFLMSFYLFLAERHDAASESRWAIMGMAVSASQAIGLHRDGSLWGLDGVETQHRRELFWEIFTYDSWQSLTFGRPPSFPVSQIDCRQPHVTDDLPGVEAFHAWKHRFTSECISVLHDQAFGARGLTYAKTLQLDKKVQAYPTPSNLDVSCSEAIPECSAMTAIALQRHIIIAVREINILYLHRSFFVKAILEFPDDPLSSPYRESVEATFRSAQRLVAMMKSLYSQFKSSCERLWFLWTHSFSCSVILASIVIRSPGIYLAPSAFAQLDVLCGLFSNVASSFRATNVLQAMLGLQRKASTALKIHQQGGRERPNMSRGDIDEVLVTLKGNVTRRPEPESPPSSRSSTSMSLQSSPKSRHSSDWDGLNHPSCSSAPGSDVETVDYSETPTQVTAYLETLSYIGRPAYGFQSLNDLPSVHDKQPHPYSLRSLEQATDHTVIYEAADSPFLNPANDAGWHALATSYPQHSETSGYFRSLTTDVTAEWPQEGTAPAIPQNPPHSTWRGLV